MVPKCSSSPKYTSFALANVEKLSPNLGRVVAVVPLPPLSNLESKDGAGGKSEMLGSLPIEQEDVRLGRIAGDRVAPTSVGTFAFFFFKNGKLRILSFHNLA